MSANADTAPVPAGIQDLLDRSGVLKATRIIPALHAERARDATTFDATLQLISADPPLAQRLMDIANSAWFGGGTKVNKVNEAFARLGTEDFYRAVVAAAIRFQAGETPEAKAWWTRSETTSRLAELVAQHLDPSLIEASFFLGLLHDCAVPLMSRWVPDYSYLALEALGCTPESLAMEQECNSFSHCEVGAILVRAWGFPAPYSPILQHHHGLTLELMPDDAARRQLGLLLLTKRIDHWCTHEVTPGFVEDSEQNLELEIANIFRLTRGQLREVISEMVRLYKLRQHHA